MAPAWQAPSDWLSDGTTFSAISPLKTGAWTSMISAKAMQNGKETPLIIKCFSVPLDVFQDPDRIARAREKFLASARLQKQLSDKNSPAWIRVFRISEDPANTCFSMEKCSGASLEDMISRKIHLTAADLYQITHSILQGFDEILQFAKRSHGSLKPSDVINCPGAVPPYRMADPSPTGDNHSANDLYSLGLVLFQLIEHHEWDPLTPIIPTKNWARFGPRRDRWIQFINMLLSPNGCQLPLANVRKEALRLKPPSPIRNLMLAAATLLILAGAGIATWHFLPANLKPWGGNNGGTGIGGIGGVVKGPVIDAQLKSDWDKAHEAYIATAEKWTTRDRTDRYDHAKSTDLFRAARAFVTDIQLTDNAAYQKSLDAYSKATAKIQEALDQYASENTIGLAADDDALTDYQSAADDFTKAKTDWEAAAEKFVPAHDHTRSIAIVQATQAPPTTAPADAAGRKATADQLRYATSRYKQALDVAHQEEIAGLSVEQAKTNLTDARAKYADALGRWDSGTAGLNFEAVSARALADRAKGDRPTELVLTDVASYQKATEEFQLATTEMEQALVALDAAKRAHNAQETDASTSLSRATEAIDKKDYASALNWYRKAADQGSPVAMFNVGLFYETGRGTEQNETEAANWYQRATDKNYTSAMVNLGLMYEKGHGVGKDTAHALKLYKQAADLKDAAAMRNIAYLYENGIGVEKDLGESLKWYHKGADVSDAASMFCIGIAYELGKGVTIDYAQAITWYKKAADLKYARAMNSLGVLNETGRGTKQDLAAALNWYKKAADLNFAPAMSNIGALYDNGIGVPLDHAQAFNWFHKGADLGNGISMYNLAVLYETGRGTTSDMNQALEWYRKAAKSDDTQARQQATDRLKALGFTP
ncbi:MAG TPA: hypothetical protein VGN88_05165 [Phycisphaerae bacterium]|jgi:TPR repeat protein